MASQTAEPTTLDHYRELLAGMNWLIGVWRILQTPILLPASARCLPSPQQVAAHRLPTRPTKRDGNTHAKGFVGVGPHGDSIEVDALPPEVLRSLVWDRIERHIDPGQLKQTLKIEQAERSSLAILSKAVTRG